MSYNSLYKLFVMNDQSTFESYYKNRFESEATIKFPFDINNNQAFIFMHNDIISQLEILREYDQRVDCAFKALPTIARTQYIKKSLIDEIEFTNQIEGIISTRKDINNVIEDIEKKSNKNNRLDGIVNRYKLLLDEKHLNILDSKDIRNLFDTMLYNEIKKDNLKNLPDGKIFRKDIVNVLGNGEKIIHVGLTPEDKIIEYIDKALKILNDKKINPYIRVAIFHYVFAYVHPFYDGNGRIDRFISSYVLSKNYTPIIGYRLSMTIKENLSQYYDAFKHTNDIRNKGDISTFVYEFLDIVIKAYQKTELYVLDKKNTLDNFTNIIENLNLNKLESKILFVLVQCELFGGFGLSYNAIKDIVKCGRTSCITIISELRKKHLIKEIRNGKVLTFTADLNNIN